MDSFECVPIDLTAYVGWRGCCHVLSQIPGREQLDWVGAREDAENRLQCETEVQLAAALRRLGMFMGLWSCGLGWNWELGPE